MIDALVKGILVGLFMAISVGPTLFVIIKYSLTSSYKSGLAFVLGVSLSDIIYVTIANVAAPFLEHMKPYEKYFAIGGGIALVVIGLTGIIKRQKPKRPSSVQATITGGHFFRIWLSGFLINTLNPGVMITWLGIVTLTVGSTTIHRIILFGTCLTIILGIDFLKVFLASRIKKLLTARRIIYMHRISAACILGIGLFLLIKTIFNINAGDQKEKNDVNKILSYNASTVYHKNLSSYRFFGQSTYLTCQSLHLSLRPHV